MFKNPADSPKPNPEFPQPAFGKLVADKDRRLCLEWKTASGELVQWPTNGLLLMNAAAIEDATWLPAGWKMSIFPAGWTRRHVECWFDFAIVAAREDNRRPDIARQLDRSPIEDPTPYPLAKSSRKHAYLMARHLGIAEKPPHDTAKKEALRVL